ncbi:hypothetical protein, partial [Secundilactobacillus paracollinoides]|uniref:hypothetical protein n=1 Tax=Secundilactobacillus paracollinoides TaxID=240427 RepID=UPI001F3FE18F
YICDEIAVFNTVSYLLLTFLHTPGQELKKRDACASRFSLFSGSLLSSRNVFRKWQGATA